LNPPEKFRKKTLCFLKLTETELSPENVDRAVIYGDFGDVPLEHLSVLANEVFLPMLTNPANQVGWPEVITKEVVENLHKFIANVYVTIGQTKGKTLLPLPPAEAGMSSGSSDGGSVESSSPGKENDGERSNALVNPKVDSKTPEIGRRSDSRAGKRGGHLDAADQRRVENRPRDGSEGGKPPRSFSGAGVLDGQSG
jgi:hypothetical protein